ncbi:MAG: acylneuraminate cytidylyltransferase family protein [Desulfovibrionaceae bacterium]|nr:acylneuraminate cytidylyltransferase family protein [Desulfovibrionaceae bacterium]
MRAPSGPHDIGEVVAIIPARGGSRGLPRKNVLDLAGKPLIAYSIETALATPSIDTVVVSTDDQEIADIAREHGALVPFLRPPGLARGKSIIGQAVHYTLVGLGLDVEDDVRVVILYPTSPFRSVRLLEMLIGRLNDGHENAATVKPVRYNPLYHMAGEGAATPFWSPGQTTCGDATPYYRTYGTFNGYRTQNATKPPYCHVLTNDVMCVDIDYQEDLMLAEEIIRQGLFDFQEAL